MTSGGFVTGARRRHTVLNLTPLIDVIFMLLLFFMLATSFDQWRRIDIAPALQPTGHQEKTKSTRPDLLLRVDTNAMTLAGRRVELLALASAISGIAPNPDSVNLIIVPGNDLKTQRLLDVLDALRDAGITQPALKSEPRKLAP